MCNYRSTTNDVEGRQGLPETEREGRREGGDVVPAKVGGESGSYCWKRENGREEGNAHWLLGKGEERGEREREVPSKRRWCLPRSPVGDRRNRRYQPPPITVLLERESLAILE